MRVLVLTSLYPTPFSPHACAHNRQQIRALSQEADVEVIAPIAWTQEWSAGRRKRREVMPKDRRIQLDSVPVRHPRYLYPPAILRRWHGRCYRMSVAGLFARAVKEFAPDVIYAPWAYPDGWTAVKLGHEASLPVVVKVMGSDVHTLSEYPARREGTLEALQQADRIVAVSRQLAGEVSAFGANPNRVHVVYNGVDRELFSPGNRSEARRRLGLDSRPRRLLFVGNLVPVKQVDVLIEACRHLVQSPEPFRCHLVGDGPLLPELAEQVERAGLSSVVSFEGVRPHAELPVWYRAADVVVLPSRSEGVPNVVLEAQAVGVPVVASGVGGIPEVISGEPHRLVPSGDAVALSAAIADVLAATPTVAQMARGPADWSDSARALKAVFEAAGNRDHAPKFSPGGQPEESDLDLAPAGAMEG